MDEASGACLCGEVRFRLQLPSKWVAHCHCSMCRRAHGAAFVTWIGVADEHGRIDDPRQRLTWYRSSANAERGFCSQCGSSLFFRSQRWPGELHVALGNVLDPVDRAPQAHVFWNDHVGWADVDPADGLPRKG